METVTNITPELYNRALDFALSVIKITRSKESYIDIVHTAMIDTEFFVADYKNAIRKVLSNQKMNGVFISLDSARLGGSFTTNGDFHCKNCNEILPQSEQVRYHLKSGAIKTLNRCWECHRIKRREYDKKIDTSGEEFKAKKSEKNEIYYLKNKDTLMQKKKSRYNTDPIQREKDKLRVKKYRETHPEWYAAYKERLNAARRVSPTEKSVA